MNDFFIRLFIKNRDLTDEKVRAKYVALAGFTGIVCNVLLFIGKLCLGLIAASVSIIADAFNNISDAGTAIVALIGLRLSLKPVDKEHPLGHGRLEYITGFIVDMVVIFVGAELLTSSIKQIISPTQPVVGNVTLILLGASILVKLWLFFFYRKIAKLTNSTAVKASAADSLTDCIATALVLFSALSARFALFGEFVVDGFAGVLVAGFILFTGIKMAKETIDLLLGSTPEPAFIQEIYNFVKQYPAIVGIHDVIVHDYGPNRKIISFHAELPADYDINLGHEIIDNLEDDMHKKFRCLVTVHLDPIVVNDEEVNTMRRLAEECAKAVDESFSIHDFRMTRGETRINIIFDLLIPVDCKFTKEAAAKAVEEKIKERNPDCFAVIRPEHPYI